MRIIDKYILKRYLVTFLFTLFILIPIAIVIDVSEKVDNFLEHPNLGFSEIMSDYYLNFTIYYSNTFMPLALFIAVIIFTSKLSNNTEIIAITNAKISFTRFLYPYFIGATLVTILALVMNHFVVPKSSKIRNKFENKYIDNKHALNKEKEIKDFSLQLTDSTYVFVRQYHADNNFGYDFSTSVYDGLKLKSKLFAENISWNKKDSTFTIQTWRKRIIYEKRDSISFGTKIDTVFGFTPKDFIYRSALSQEMTSDDLLKFINLSKKRGVKNLNAYLVEFHKRTSLPIASYILTLLAVTMTYRKKRGGLGVNLAVGLGIMFVYIFVMKITEVLGAVAGVNSLLYVWIPNIFFGLLATYLFYNARK